MLEVSARAMDMMFDTGEMAGLSRSEVRAGFGFGDTVPPRFDWDVFARGCDWLLSRIGSPETMENAARDCFVRSTGTRPQVHLLRLFSSPRALYWSLHRFGGHALFANATTDVESISHTRLRFTVTMDGVPSMGFWVMCAGVIAAAPCAIGYPASVVRFETTGSRCDYYVEHTQSRSIFAKIRALFISVFSRGRVFDELEAQKAALNDQLRDLEIANRHAERALALNTRFLTTVTHELRTPLAGIIGLSDIIAEVRAPGMEMPEIARQIRSSSHRLLQIVNDVMTLDGAEASTVRSEPTDLAPMLEALISGYRGATQARGIQLFSAVAHDAPPAIEVDRNLVLHVLRCLMDNAVAFTARGHIAVHARMEEGLLVIDVEDSGCGIAPGLHAHIFEPFAQVDETLTRSHQGLGLGLAVARRLAHTLGGDVLLRSALGEGSTFTLRIPARSLAEAVGGELPPLPRHTVPVAPAPAVRISISPRPISIAPPPPPPPSADTDGFDLLSSGPVPLTSPVAPAVRQHMGRALVVEDNLVNQKILQRLLTGLGMQVDVAENGQVAVEACTARTYDIIFMDLQMPVMDGFRATEEIRRVLDTPIYAVTANSEQQFRDRALQVGMNGLLPKPISRATVSDVLATVSIPPRSITPAV